MAEALFAAIQAFGAAAASDQPRTAKAWSTEAGWASRADSAARLARQIARDRLILDLTGPTFNGPGGARSAVRTQVMDGSENTGSTWILCESTPYGWRVEGFADHRVVLGLFLAGEYSPVVPLTSLDAHSVASAWGEAFVRALQSGTAHDPRIARARAGGETEIALLGVHYLEAVQRSAVIVEARHPEHRTGSRSQSVLHHHGGEVSVVANGQVPGLHTLLQGVDAAWDTTVPAGDAPEQRAEALLTAAFSHFLRFFGVDGEVSGLALLDFLSREVDAGRLPKANLLDPDHLAQTWGGQLPDRVEARVQAEVYVALRKHGIDPVAIDVDGAAGQALVDEHGEAIVRALFVGVLLASSPTPTDGPDPAPTDVGPWLRAALRRMSPDA